MAAVEFTPENNNQLRKVGFKFLVKKLPNVNFFAQEISIPGIAIANAPAAPNPFVQIPYSGEHIMYNELKVSFAVDEDMKNYMEIHNWIKGLGFDQNFGQYDEIAKQKQATGMGLKSDASIIIETNGKVPNFEVVFQDAFPISVSDLEFSTTESNLSMIKATALFRYTLYTINRL